MSLLFSFPRFYLSLVVVAASSVGYAWDTPLVLYADVSGTTRPDAHVSAAAGVAGQWGVVWTSDAPLGTDFGILFQRSTNDAATWSSPADISLATANTADTGDQPFLATDGNLTWIAAWDADSATTSLISIGRDIYFARSTDGGATWGPPFVLNSDAADPLRVNSAVCLGTDGAGLWLAVWHALSTSSTLYGYDADIMFARSTDNGLTWSPAAVLNSNAATDRDSDMRPRLATDKAGNWVAVWQTYGVDDTTSKVVADIYAARSTDNGMTWQPPVLVSTSGVPDPQYDDHPALSWAGGSVYVVAWVSGETQVSPSEPGSRIWVARSTDGGATFGAPVNLLPGAAFLAAAHPDLAKVGTALALLYDVATSGNPQPQVHAAFSFDTGITWTIDGPITSMPAAAGVRPSVASSASGKVLVAWPAGRVDRTNDYYFSKKTIAPAGIRDWMLW
jgi:hypothetical protein